MTDQTSTETTTEALAAEFDGLISEMGIISAASARQMIEEETGIEASRREIARAWGQAAARYAAS